jgi:hypothetical protein
MYPHAGSTTGCRAAAGSGKGTATSTKDWKLTKPKTFSGRPEDLDDFLNDCELIFSIKGDIYNQDDKKIVYALALMKTGNTGLWKQQYVQEYFALNNGVL